MLPITGGVNTHRGALWALGLLVAGARPPPGRPSAERSSPRALAAYRTPRCSAATAVSHGERARLRYGAARRSGEAEAGFPHVVEVALPALRRQPPARRGERPRALDALLAIMAASTTPACCTAAARGPAASYGSAPRASWPRAARAPPPAAALLERLDRLRRTRRLSPGGSGDLLAAALFLDMVLAAVGRERLPCRR